MKQCVRSISLRKFNRIQQLGKVVQASIFNKEDWTTKPAYNAVVYNDYIYCVERTKSLNFSTVIKKYPLKLAREQYNIVVVPPKYSYKEVLR